MKYLILLLSCFTFQLNAQHNLEFSKYFIDGVNQWVGVDVSKEKDVYDITYGFVYIDNHAGLTFRHEGDFSFLKDSITITNTTKIDKGINLTRIKRTNHKIALLPEKIILQLGLDSTPDWLKVYSENNESEKAFYTRGYLYNEWNRCETAKEFLEKGTKAYPKSKKIITELAFSYNCLSEFDKAEKLLENTTAVFPKDDYINKEFIYTLIKTKKLEDASRVIKETLKRLPSSRFHGENLYNLMYSYYSIKDSKNFKKWLSKAKKWNAKNQKHLDAISSMQIELGI